MHFEYSYALVGSCKGLWKIIFNSQSQSSSILREGHQLMSIWNNLLEAFLHVLLGSSLYESWVNTRWLSITCRFLKIKPVLTNFDNQLITDNNNNNIWNRIVGSFKTTRNLYKYMYNEYWFLHHSDSLSLSLSIYTDLM